MRRVERKRDHARKFYRPKNEMSYILGHFMAIDDHVRTHMMEIMQS